MVRDTWPRQHHAGPRHQWAQDRFVGDPPLDDTRYQEVNEAHRPRVLTVTQALRDHCNLPVSSFLLLARLENGQDEVFSGPDRYQGDNVERFVNMNAWRREMTRIDSGESPVGDPETGYGTDSYGRQQQRLATGSSLGLVDRRRQNATFFDDDATSRARKRSRTHKPEDEIPQATAGTARRCLRVRDHAELWDFYDQRFRNCQQTACKLLAKAWVKVMEPKKQTNHPYTGSDERAPDWWPQPWGRTKDEKVRHKEPDHLYKRERVHLLVHILRMVMEPRNKQDPSIRKLGLNVDKLREATDEALSLFFSGKENEKNAKKKPYLDEIFKVAKFEQRFKNGEIDDDTQIWVMAEAKFPDNGNSENDDGSATKDEADAPPPAAANSSPAKPAIQHDGLLHAQGYGHGQPHGQPHGHVHAHNQTAASHLQGGSFMGEMPVRPSSQYSAPMLAPSMHADQHFVENNALHASPSLPLHHGMVPPAQDNHRRHSLYASPTEYSNPPSAGLYNQSWPEGSGAPGPSPIYTFPNHPTTSTAESFGNHSTIPVAQSQYLNPSYDAGLPRSSFDQGAPMFRTPPSAPNSQAFPGYLDSQGRSVAGPGVKPDPLSRGQLP